MPRKRQRLEIVHPDCAGIDIGKSRHYVAIDPERSATSVRSFGAFTDDLESLAQWLRECGIRIVAMESTGVYWIPVYEVLDRAGFEVHLVNPRATKQVSGRKSDVLDCQWLWQLMSYGLLRGAFRPPDEVCVLRSYVRQRARLVRDAARSVQHMQKALTEMNVQLDSVLSDIMGKTGEQIVRAIVAGERDGEVLARYRDRRVRADEATIARSLRGTWREEHLFALTQALARHDLLQAQILACDARIGQAVASLARDAGDAGDTPPPARRSASRSSRERTLHAGLGRVLGVDLTAIPMIGADTALVVASEIGPDLSRFPDSQHFCSWLNLAPGTRISGEKRIAGAYSPHRTNVAGQALRMAAANARSSDSFIGAAHRARLARMPTGKAIKATAHQLARLIYALLTRGEAYVERGIEAFEAERSERMLRNLHRRANALGLALVPAGEAA
jgi:transposase